MEVILVNPIPMKSAVEVKELNFRILVVMLSMVEIGFAATMHVDLEICK